VLANNKGNQIANEVFAVLRWKNNSEDEQELYLRKGDVADIGRREDNEVYLSSKLVSRCHAVIAWRDDAFILTDLLSENGTSVNEEKINKPFKIKNNDIILCADTPIEYKLIQTKLDATELKKDGATLIVRSESVQPRLIVSSGLHEGKEFLLYPGKVVVGRATSKESYDISLQDKAISRPQMEIEHKENRIYISDLESVNGTLVNGEIITETEELRDGDVIEIGETTILFKIK